MRQKNQIELNLGTGGAGEAGNAATQESEILTAKAMLHRAVAAKALDFRADRRAVRVGRAPLPRGDALIGIAALQLELPTVEIYADTGGD